MKNKILKENEYTQRWSPRYYYIAVSLLILFTTAALFLMSSRRSLQPIQEYICSSSFVVETEFRSTSEYRDLSPTGDEAWENLLTPNGGFFIQESDGITHKYGITMFHQLHCLQMIRFGLQAVSNSSASQFLDEHVAHCLDYLRQVRDSLRFGRAKYSIMLSMAREYFAMPTLRLKIQ